MKTGIGRLDALVDLRTLSRDELLSRLRIDEASVEPGYAYESMTGLERAYDPDRLPVHVYFDGDEVVMMFTEEAAFLDSVTPESVRERLGEPTLTLRSSAGKRSTLWVYPGAGLAVSAGGDTDAVDFVEVFPPTTAEEYEQNIYDDPGPFIK